MRKRWNRVFAYPILRRRTARRPDGVSDDISLNLKGEFMCDYSLGEIRNRLAVEGETLVVRRFRTSTIGLASPPESIPPGATTSVWRRVGNFLSSVFAPACETAVCVPPGASLLL